MVLFGCVYYADVAQRPEEIPASEVVLGSELTPPPAEQLYSLEFPGGELGLTPDYSFLPEDASSVFDSEFHPEEDYALTATLRTFNLDDDLHGDLVTYDIPMVDNKQVQKYIRYYTEKQRKWFTVWMERSSRYVPLMEEIFIEEGLPRDLVYVAMIESGFNPRAYSWAHAVGPWQFISSTGKLMGLKHDWWYDERRDIEKSTRAAARFLKDLHNRFDDWYLALAAYNAGPGKMSRAIKKYKTRDFWKICKGRYLAPETKAYVPKLLAVVQIARQPEKYGLGDINWQEPLEWEVVTLPTSTDLEVVSRLSGVDYDTIKKLNPELKRWSTPPHLKNYELRLPVGSKDVFEPLYAKLPKSKRANYKHYRVKSGDTVSGIASRYGIRVKDVLAMNKIRNANRLRVGQDLVLPLRKGYNPSVATELRDDHNKTRRRVYTVKKGDSLWSISRRFGVSTKQLRVWNRLGWNNVIRPGQKLKVS
jgi:membrane-bound lytic murein transglycosylase D